MVVFGRDFDTDKQLPWAGDILKTSGDSSGKTFALRQAAKKHLGVR